MMTFNSLSSRVTCGTLGMAQDVQLRPFPPLVRIETTNACNARCTICPHSEMAREIRWMDDGLFERIIDQCAAGGCREIHLHNFGEPMLDRQIEQRVAAAKQRGVPRVKIFCNGSLLDEQRMKGLLEAGLDELKVSFDGATREEFERIRRPLRFDRVVGNVHRAVRLRNQMHAKTRIRVACCSTSDRQATMRSLEQCVDGFSFGKIHNWGGDGPSTAPRGTRKPCSRLWRTFTILASGEVSLCCLDYDGRHVLGRVDDGTSIADVWRGDRYREVRRLHRTGRQSEIELCRDCTKSFL